MVYLARKTGDVGTTAPPPSWRRQLPQWIQQLYFLRFPVLGWLTLPLLCAIDWITGASTVTRGIMTMSRTWQAFYAAFFVAALMNTVLICAKNIVRNGRERFASEDVMPARLRREQPSWLERTLKDRTRSTILRVLAFAHMPTLVTLLYVGITTHQEGETGFFLPVLGSAYWHMWVGFAIGLGAAFVFWYAVSIFYLWVYPYTPIGDPGYREPAALLFPEGLAGMKQAQNASKPKVATWAEWVVKPLARISYAGYAESPQLMIWEYHTLSVVALGWFLMLYLFLYPLTAPVTLSKRPVVSSIVAVVLAAVLLWGTRAEKPKENAEDPNQDAEGPDQDEEEPDPDAEGANHSVEDPVQDAARREQGKPVVIAMRCVIAGALLFFLAVIWYNSHYYTVLMENAFPVLASVLVILIFLQWFVSGASFFFDRFRVPVLTALLALLFVSKICLQWVDQEHYFEARDTKRVTELATPFEAMATRMQQHPGEPYVIVTATGGGIQAAEWTAQVMAQMEKRVRDDGELKSHGYTLHDHLLLASGVSGGSVGLMPYLLEYTTTMNEKAGTTEPMFQTVEKSKDGAAPLLPDLLTRRLTLAPGCSSLEAVAWGLAYYDLERLLLTVPLLPSVANPSLRGDTPSAPDRTWALTQSFNRNFSDRDCGTDPAAQKEGETFSALPQIESGGAATLRSTAGRLHLGLMPAFTFNTTVAETGGRFLLSNYGLGAVTPQGCDSRCPPVLPGTEFLPSESFLQAYGMESNCDLPQIKADCYADISLATAARLSATFPLVSSATRIPRRYATRASHFVDGGYFDNDGTGSVTEFLLSAMQEQEASKQKKPPSGENALALPEGRLKILLLEIRDGDDMDPTQNQDDLDHQTGKSLAKYASQPSAWTTTNQLLAPLAAMWGAGHESITRRNRRELCLLTERYASSLEIHHVVVGIPPAPQAGKAGVTKPAPLNWKLTAAQRQYIDSWATVPDLPTQQALTQAIAWVKESLPGSKRPPENEVPCTIYDQTYMRSDMR